MSDVPKNAERISAIVPARNEEAVIRACIESLAIQQAIDEILVVNDQSTDRTAEIARDIAQSVPRLRLLETRQLPPGWVGKNNAVWLGALEASGEWLLFTDADAVHEKDSAAKALAIAGEQNAALVSFSPQQVTETWYEKALIPYVYCRLGGKFSFDDVNDPRKEAAAANGQFLMVRRDVYAAVGGHASVAGEVLEDVALARKVKSAGHRIWFGSGQGFVRVRMYRGYAAMWEGWRKNLYPLMGGKPSPMAQEIYHTIVPLLAPLVAACAAWGLAKSAWAAAGMLVIGLLAIVVPYDRQLRRNQFPPSLAWYAVPARLLFAAVLWASYRGYKRGKLGWKGREYPVGTPGASKG